MIGVFFERFLKSCFKYDEITYKLSGGKERREEKKKKKKIKEEEKKKEEEEGKKKVYNDIKIRKSR